jgi:aspartoacylase
MSQHSVVNTILITAGTHGNELSGIEYVKNLQANKQLRDQLLSQAPGIDIELAIVNKLAVEKRTRYVEEDLNRQFSNEKLSALAGDNLEHQLAIEFNLAFGPKYQPSRDLVIDIHNTTSNMGPTLIILQSDEFHQKMAQYVKANMPEVIILIEDHIPYKQHPYLCTIGKTGIMLEVGPQPHSVLRPAAYLQTEQMTKLVVTFCDLWNRQALGHLDVVDAFRLTEEVYFPLSPAGNKLAMIHPSIQNNDFMILNKGDPAFLTFEGETLNWEGEDGVFPHFIGESAYYHLNIAFALSRKTSI